MRISRPLSQVLLIGTVFAVAIFLPFGFSRNQPQQTAEAYVSPGLGQCPAGYRSADLACLNAYPNPSCHRICIPDGVASSTYPIYPAPAPVSTSSCPYGSVVQFYCDSNGGNCRNYCVGNGTTPPYNTPVNSPSSSANQVCPYGSVVQFYCDANGGGCRNYCVGNGLTSPYGTLSTTASSSYYPVSTTTNSVTQCPYGSVVQFYCDSHNGNCRNYCVGNGMPSPFGTLADANAQSALTTTAPSASTNKCPFGYVIQFYCDSNGGGCQDHCVGNGGSFPVGGSPVRSSTPSINYSNNYPTPAVPAAKCPFGYVVQFYCDSSGGACQDHCVGNGGSFPVGGTQSSFSSSTYYNYASPAATPVSGGKCAFGYVIQFYCDTNGGNCRDHCVGVGGSYPL